MTKGEALSGARFDWDRELCNQGCMEWVPWYTGVKGITKGKTVYGCRIGRIPEKNNGQWCCRHRKVRKRSKEDT